MGWIFLGFGAMVIIGQAVPAVLMMIGLAKGLVGKETKHVHREGIVKQTQQ